VTSARAPSGHCLAPGRRVDASGETGGYGRLFPQLSPLVVDAERLHALGRPGGACDEREADERFANVAAGWPFFGQLVAHDITADRSPLGHAADAAIRNFRRPRLDLECVYGGGPVGSPYLYDRNDPAKLLVGDGGIDVPRNVQGVALLGDPRNDVHLFVNQLHVALLRAHNGIVDRLRAEQSAGDDAVFDDARRLLVWHYQWVVLNEFLPSQVGVELAKSVAAMPPSQRLATSSTIPVEFADAAYRYGHAQIRQTYRINGHSGELAVFPDLLGFRPVAAERAIEWPLLFDMPEHPPAQRAARIDGRLPRALLELPHAVSGDVEDTSYRSLAGRDLQRGLATGLPSGEAVARALGLKPLPAADIGLDRWDAETPLWFYIGREADVCGEGDRLGPVGGRIVAEVFLAIADADPSSFRVVEPGWQPTLPSFTGRAEHFGLADLLRLAG